VIKLREESSISFILFSQIILSLLNLTIIFFSYKLNKEHFSLTIFSSRSGQISELDELVDSVDKALFLR
jgi:hypothetical protein